MIRQTNTSGSIGHFHPMLQSSNWMDLWNKKQKAPEATIKKFRMESENLGHKEIGWRVLKME